MIGKRTGKFFSTRSEDLSNKINKLKSQIKKVAIVAVLALSACGGGGASSAVKPVILMPGDSLTAGAALAVPPGERLAQLTGGRFDVEVRADPGAILIQSLNGINLGAVIWPWAGTTWAQMLQQEHPAITILRWGGSDTVAQTAPEEFRAELTQAVRQAKAVSLVYVVGVIESPQFAQGSAVINEVVQEVAVAEGVAFIDVRALSFDPAVDLLPGDVHPSQSYSDRIEALEAGWTRAARELR